MATDFTMSDNRLNAVCPQCQSYERHRLYYLYLKTVIPTLPTRVLHFAPEQILTELFKSHPHVTYISADKNPRCAMRAEDITHLSFPSNAFDIIVASHVLEHIPDDKRAMKELCRVLHPQGFALLQVPLKPGSTYENPNIVTPEERRKHFGTPFHVRYYGEADYHYRLQAAGFSVVIDPFYYTLSEEEHHRYGLLPENIYRCKKNIITIL